MTAIRKRRLYNPVHKYPKGYAGLAHSPDLVRKYIIDFWQVNKSRDMKPVTYTVAGVEVTA